MAVAADGVDVLVNDSFDQAYLENLLVNLKSLMDNHFSHNDVRESDAQALLASRNIRSEDLQAKINEQHLTNASNNQRLVNAMAEGNAIVQNRIASNAVSLDGMVLGGLMTRPDELAESVIGKNQADTTADVSRDVIRGAGANTAMTSPPSQGTTGVAQGALQAQEPILQASELAGMVEVNKALGVQLAKLAEAVNVLIIREVDK
ncbi:MAG: hypothetical protein ACYSW8_31150 [Planctomycetota bacterium]|jgi:hypothetical protein